MRARLLFAIGASVLGAVAPACLPEIDFTAPSSDGGDLLDGPSPTRDGSMIPSDGSAGDAGSLDATPSTDAPPDAPPDPNAIGPFFENQLSTYDWTAICAERGGTLYCWGDYGSNQWGQLGLPVDTPTTGNYPLPTAIPTTKPASEITHIAMGSRHTCTLYGRTPYCRGDNTLVQLGDTTASTGPTEVAPIGLPGGGFDLIAAASAATCGITLIPDAGAGSNIYCWGSNEDGELARPIGPPSETGDPVTGNIDGGPLGLIPDAIAIAGGANHFCIISKSQGVMCWGGTGYRESGPTEGPDGGCLGGDETTCSPEPQHVPLPATDAGAPEVPVAVAVGDFHSCALTQSGNVYCWGVNDVGELGNGGAALPQTCPGNEITNPPCTGIAQKVVGLSTPIKAISAGGYSTCAIDTSNHAYCWGDDSEGQLGDSERGSQSFNATPVAVLDPSSAQPMTFDRIAVGAEGACATNGDTLYCWGIGALATALPDAGTTPLFSAPAPVVDF